jgi:hypothetical protein
MVVALTENTEKRKGVRRHKYLCSRVSVGIASVLVPRGLGFVVM